MPASPDLQALMPKLLAGTTSVAEETEFGPLRQAWIKRILIDHFDDPERVVCRETRTVP